MHGIFGMTDLALDARDDAERRDFLERARACAQGLMTLLNDVLDFSKIEAGKCELEEIEFDVRAVLDGVLDSIAVEADRRQLELVGSVDAGVPATLRGDPGRLRQVLMNLASNALKFTDRGEIEIRIERHDARDSPPSRPGEVAVRGTVRDTGIGIPRDKQRVIFDAFTQADSSDTRRYGGTGLGLAISRHLVSLMGGQIAVESEVGRGSTFPFTARLGSVAGARSSGALRTLAGLRVLIVDANVTSRRALERTLRAAGCAVRSVAGGPDAEALLGQATHFDVVLLDLSLRHLTARGDGEAPGARPSTPIIALGSIRGERAASALGAEFAGCVRKPIKEEELLDAIASVTLAANTVPSSAA